MTYRSSQQLKQPLPHWRAIIVGQRHEQIEQSIKGVLNVTTRKIEVGSFLSPGEEALTVEDRSRLRVTFRVSEKLLPRVKITTGSAPRQAPAAIARTPASTRSATAPSSGPALENCSAAA